MLRAGVLWLAGAAVVLAVPLHERLDLFEANTGGYGLYRIPGIVVTKAGTVLAYAEAREAGRGDWNTIDIVLRRSTDGGRTFSPFRKIAAIDGPYAKNPVALAQGLANSSAITYNNPVAIADMRSGAVHFLFCYEYMRAFYMRSDDDGQTFSKPVEITGAFEPLRAKYPWKVLATGPGHGIQTRRARLIVPVWISTGTGGHAHRPSVNATIFSDDNGRTWRAGEIAIPDTPDTIIPNETAAVETSDGRVLLNARSESKHHRRLLTYSKDGATGWSAAVAHDQLWEPICFGSMVALPGKPGAILFSNPHNLDRAAGAAEPGKRRDRRNLAIKLSHDDGKTWPRSKVVDAGVAGYSDLAAGPDGTIYCLYERGGVGNQSTQTSFLTLVRLNREWLTSD